MNIMNQKIAFVVAGLGALAAMGCMGTAQGADGSTIAEAEAAITAEEVCPAGVPASLTPAADQSIKMKLNAVGVQVYVCTPTATNATPSWVLVNPQANLMKDCGELVGTHFIGPTWQGNDGSSVVGVKAAGATVDATAIPWLLLTAKSHSTEAGIFDDVTSIQRLATVGGNAPATGCDATTVGTVNQAPYSAEYVFYKTKTKGKVQQCGGS
jgi:hypothetical protein